MAGLVVLGVVVLMVVENGGGAAGAVHHTVGGDQGWDTASDVAAWSIGRSFRVGDNIWFTYSAAHESIAEVGSRAEYESCDVTNPIRMYTGGLDRVELDRQGTRYFASTTPESCYNGLKLHVQVEPAQAELAGKRSPIQSQTAAVVEAAGPKPSGSVLVGPVSSVLMWVGLALLWFMGFLQRV